MTIKQSIIGKIPYQKLNKTTFDPRDWCKLLPSFQQTRHHLVFGSYETESLDLTLAADSTAN